MAAPKTSKQPCFGRASRPSSRNHPPYSASVKDPRAVKDQATRQRATVKGTSRSRLHVPQHQPFSRADGTQQLAEADRSDLPQCRQRRIGAIDDRQKQKQPVFGLQNLGGNRPASVREMRSASAQGTSETVSAVRALRFICVPARPAVRRRAEGRRTRLKEERLLAYAGVLDALAVSVSSFTPVSDAAIF